MGKRTHGKNTEIVLAEIKKIHGEKFLYDKFQYVNCKTKVSVGCKVHGYFEKYPNDLKRINGGCPRCNNSFFKTDNEFKVELLNKFPNYMYDGTYKNAKTKLFFTCLEHQHSFSSTPNSILLGHTGCIDCYANKQIQTRVLKGQMTDPLLKSDYENYRRAVWKFSNRSFKKYMTGQKRDRQNHLDHILSIVDGYNNKVPAEIVGSIHNLRIISGTSNRNKSYKSYISVEELLERFNNEKIIVHGA